MSQPTPPLAQGAASMAALPTSNTTANPTSSTTAEHQRPRISLRSSRSNIPGPDIALPTPHDAANVLARPTFGHWAKYHWIDVLFIGLLGALSYLLFRLPPYRSKHRYFKYPVDEGQRLPEAYAQPYISPILSSYAAGIIGVGIPIFFAALLQFRVRCFWDFSNAVLGVGLGAAITSFCISLLKFFIGGLRPHFYAVCEPVPTPPGRGPQGDYFNRTICTGDYVRVSEAMKSFPSGHSGVLFVGAVFLTLYLNAKLKVWPGYRCRAWKMCLTVLPITYATILALTLTTDTQHHWYDILVGALIGTAVAFAVYRGGYAAIWNNEINHIPLVPHTSITPYLGSLREKAIFTRNAQWHHSTKLANSPAIELPRHIDRHGERLSYDVVSHMISSSPPPIRPSNSNGSMRATYQPSRRRISSCSNSSSGSVSTAIQRWYQQQASSRRSSASTAILVRDSGDETIGTAS